MLNVTSAEVSADGCGTYAQVGKPKNPKLMDSSQTVHQHILLTSTRSPGPYSCFCPLRERRSGTLWLLILRFWFVPFLALSLL